MRIDATNKCFSKSKLILIRAKFIYIGLWFIKIAIFIWNLNYNRSKWKKINNKNINSDNIWKKINYIQPLFYPKNGQKSREYIKY